jgi:hypothetical protein
MRPTRWTWFPVLAALWLISAAAAPERGRPPDAKPTTRDARKDLGTLDEINIEGEVAVPRVLFITARDRERFHDPLHRLYLRSSTELGRDMRFPLPRGARPCP